MTDNITMVKDLGPTVDWIGIIGIFIAIFALFIAWLSRNVANKSLKLNIFSSLIKELSEENARRDRGLVSRIKSNKKEDIQKLIELAWTDDNSNDANLGRAAERTIGHLDRVGFFLLGKGNNPRTDAPEWLWTLVKNMWDKLGNWVEYRQTYDKDNPKFYHKAYGLYFKRLEDYRIKNKF